MNSSSLEKLPDTFSASFVPENLPGEGEAVIVVASVSAITPVELPLDELRRADAVTHEEARIQYLVGRYLLRGVLSQWLGIRPCDLPITLTSSGKPVLSESGMPYFSITHTAKSIAAIFSLQPVGIDLEQERPVDVCALARRFFSKEEADFLEQSGSQSDFYRLWCCREAAIKGDGKGLAKVLSTTRVSPHSIRTSRKVSVLIGEDSWSASPWTLAGGIHGAAAFLEVPGVIRWCDLG